MRVKEAITPSARRLKLDSRSVHDTLQTAQGAVERQSDLGLASGQSARALQAHVGRRAAPGL
eukprot:427317-Rhodomonas_salina.1